MRPLSTETSAAGLEANLRRMRMVAPQFVYLDGFARIDGFSTLVWILRWKDLESGGGAEILRTPSFGRYCQVVSLIGDERKGLFRPLRKSPEKEVEPTVYEQEAIHA